MIRFVIQFLLFTYTTAATLGCRQTSIFAYEQLPVDTISTGTDSATGKLDTTTVETDSATVTSLGSDSETVSDDTVTGTDSDSDTGSDTVAGTDSSSDTQQEGCGVPDSFSWTASDILIYPASGYDAIKDPTVVRDTDVWHVYASTIAPPDFNMAYFSVTDWNELSGQSEAVNYVPANTNANLTGYKSAPQLFYFSPQQLWYLVYHTSEPAYSTSTNPGDVMSWTPMTLFMSMPRFLTETGYSGLDYWIICDDTDCYMFFSALNGGLYRTKTSRGDFPGGFGNEIIEVMKEENKLDLFSASNIYKIKGTDAYLLLVSAIGEEGRYFRSWTTNRLDGEWVPLADTPENAFISVRNVTGANWFDYGFSHGEMLRINNDETMTIDTCDMKYLFSGHYMDETYEDLEHYALGLLSDAQ